MLAEVGSEIPIKQDQLALWRKRAKQLLTSTPYTPRKDLETVREGLKPKAEQAEWLSSGKTNPSAESSVAILKTAKAINGDDDLFDPGLNASLTAVRTGLQIGLHLADLYATSSGLKRLQDRRDTPGVKLTPSEQEEWRSKMETQAAITVFCASYYTVKTLMDGKGDGPQETPAKFAGIPETLPLGGQTSALGALLYHWGSYLKEAQTGTEVLKITEAYFKAVLEDVKIQIASGMFKFTEAFTERSYKLESSTFSVQGFKGEVQGGGKSADFKRISLEDIVGNREAKRHAYRIAQYLIAYDFERRMNPMVEFGAFPWIYIYIGKPGTGKTLLLAAICTMVNDYCQKLGLPFIVHVFPPTMVSTFQGGSAENAENYFRVIRNPNILILCPWDDIENVMIERTREGVSSGQREVVGNILVNTEGVGAILRGNALLLNATNIPDQIDQAYMNRIQGRAPVNGAETIHDWMDQIGLFTRRIGATWAKEMLKSVKWPTPIYEFLSDQKLRSLVEKRSENITQFQDKRLAEIYDRVMKQYKPDQFYEYSGHFFHEVSKEFPLFSSRDERNIEVAVSTRYFDFDFPEDWLKDRDLFVAKNYDEKKGLILEEQKKHIGGLTFPEVFREEAMRYLDTTVRILDGGFTRRVEEQVQKMRESATAKQQFATQYPELNKILFFQ